MEVLALRLDHLKARATYVTTLKAWLDEGKLNGRLVSRGQLHILIVEGKIESIDEVLEKFNTLPIDTNARDERCIDKFFDVLGRKSRETLKLKSGLTDMQILNDAMLDKLVLEEWDVPAEWIEFARSTDRSKRFLAWKEQAKITRKEGRRRNAKLRDETKQKKREEKRKRQEGNVSPLKKLKDDNNEE